MIGTVHKKGNESVIIFNTKDAVLFLTEEELRDSDGSTNDPGEGSGKDGRSPRQYAKRIRAFPAEWANSFGEKYYTSCAIGDIEEPEDGIWKTDDRGTPYKEAEKEVTTRAEAATMIKQILGNIGANDEPVE